MPKIEITQPGTDVPRLLTHDPGYVQACLRKIGDLNVLQTIPTGGLIHLNAPNGTKVGMSMLTRGEALQGVERRDLFLINRKPLEVVAIVAYNALNASGDLGVAWADFEHISPIATYKRRPFGITGVSLSPTALRPKGHKLVNSTTLCTMTRAFNNPRGLTLLTTGNYIHDPMQKIEGVWKAMPFNPTTNKYEEVQVA